MKKENIDIRGMSETNLNVDQEVDGSTRVGTLYGSEKTN
jgi:hypothetical protein